MRDDTGSPVVSARVWAEKRISGRKYGNYVSGGTYYRTPNVAKDTIRIMYPAPNPNPD